MDPPPRTITLLAQHSHIYDHLEPHDSSTNNKNVRPPPSTFMYNDVKAAMYKEWKVQKKNKYGKWQHRMLGLDMHKVYNSKVGERAIISRTNIKVVRMPPTCRHQAQVSLYRPSGPSRASRGSDFFPIRVISKSTTATLKKKRLITRRGRPTNAVREMTTPFHVHICSHVCAL